MERYESIGKNMDESSIIAYTHSKRYTCLKRLSDALVSLIIIVLNLPVLILILAYILIRYDKPSFAYSEVLGLRGEKFKIYRVLKKDREENMLVKCTNKECSACNAEQVEKYRDRSIIQRILESAYIKKLLLFFNVLKGDMSIVGPAPKSANELKTCEKWYCTRLSVRPGITGLWQICRRSDHEIDEMIWYDLKYIRECSLMYDLKIVIKTFKKNPNSFG